MTYDKHLLNPLLLYKTHLYNPHIGFDPLSEGIPEELSTRRGSGGAGMCIKTI
jgi:hypothetical protein